MDKELLERAAKAAGLDVWTCIDGNYYTSNNVSAELPWNPLTDDGDAMRLAVKLKIDVCWNNNEGPWEVNAWPRIGIGSGEDENNDSYAATRRAIVRAAAEIGKEI